MEKLSESNPSYLGEIFLTENGQADVKVLEVIWENFQQASTQAGNMRLSANGTEHWQIVGELCKNIKVTIEIRDCPQPIIDKIRKSAEEITTVGLARAYKKLGGIDEVTWKYTDVKNLVILQKNYDDIIVTFNGTFNDISKSANTN